MFVFYLRDIDGLSYEELTEVLGISVPEVKSRLYVCRLFKR
ncbi:MAG: hypothetical protein HYW01_08660 [Deltaproteobacteria bacterium]|nr:hypothetical protein [Deltaproteobacteria bacterium]